MGSLEWVPLGLASERPQQKVWWEVAERGWDSHASDFSPVCVPDYRSQLPLGSALHGFPLYVLVTYPSPRTTAPSHRILHIRFLGLPPTFCKAPCESFHT